jgi:hypothetical protein
VSIKAIKQQKMQSTAAFREVLPDLSRIYRPTIACQKIYRSVV